MSWETGAMKGWWYEAQQGGFHGDPVSRNHPYHWPANQHGCTLETSVEILT